MPTCPIMEALRAAQKAAPMPAAVPEATIKVLESTAPLLAKAGPEFTRKFYIRMFSNHPELKDIFIESNQRNLAQPRALLDAVAAYATNLRDLTPVLPAVERIAQKHASFNIKAEQYPIVGENLLKTIEVEFGVGKDVLDEWARAYQALADIFIKREEEIYKAVECLDGGWRGVRSFKVSRKERLSDCVVGFTFVPADGGKVAAHKPGQYLALYTRHPSFQNQEIRQYSIVNAPNGENYQIAVKLHDKGAVSHYLHNSVGEGDTLMLAPPYGDFFMEVPAADAPVLLMSGGIGLTPMLCMLRTLAEKKHKGPVYWVNQAHNCKSRAFTAEVHKFKKQLPQLKTFMWVTNAGESDKVGVDYDYTGHFVLSSVADVLFSNATKLQCYFTGPIGFMEEAERQLLSSGVPKANLHYECFGPFHSLKV